MSSDGPFALAPDGSAKDCRAFQQALRSDAEKMAQLEKVLIGMKACLMHGVRH
jgi:hypothetical protein